MNINSVMTAAGVSGNAISRGFLLPKTIQALKGQIERKDYEDKTHLCLPQPIDVLLQKRA
jgi:hypothetical protein